ncbi:hypothetical protein BC830DRAFT_1135522 [Chytriomyces sp. MP71]|nr:hypothetical protein BC830DRAFT_1135522 [Chytriomyces sp. MP71]
MGHNGGNLALVLSASLDAMPACAWQCVRAMYSTPSWSVERHELRRRSTAVRSLCADSDFAASFAICTAATCALNSPEAGLATALIPLITDSCESAHLLTGDSLASYSASLAFLPECGAECMAAGFADHLASLAPVLNTTSSTSITNATNATTSHDQFYTTLMQDICLDDSFSIWFKYCVNSVCSENDVDYISMLQLVGLTFNLSTQFVSWTNLATRPHYLFDCQST